MLNVRFLLVLPKTVKKFSLLLIDQDRTEAQGREHTQEIKILIWFWFAKITQGRRAKSMQKKKLQIQYNKKIKKNRIEIKLREIIE